MKSNSLHFNGSTDINIGRFFYFRNTLASNRTQNVGKIYIAL